MNWTEEPGFAKIKIHAMSRKEEKETPKNIRAVGQEILFPSFAVTVVDGEDAFRRVDTITGDQGELSTPLFEYFVL
jgi:hypothetical protein